MSDNYTGPLASQTTRHYAVTTKNLPSAVDEAFGATQVNPNPTNPFRVTDEQARGFLAQAEAEAAVLAEVPEVNLDDAVGAIESILAAQGIVPTSIIITGTLGDEGPEVSINIDL